MAQLLIPRELRNLDRSTYKLSQLAKRVAMPRGIAGTDWGPIAKTCREDMGIEFDGWQDGAGQLLLARSTEESLDEGGVLAHTVGGFNLSAQRQVGKTHWGAGSLFGMCQHYPELLVIWSSHHSKALSYDTEILTANRGWVTMDSIRVGDQVIHPSGKPTRVEYASEIFLSNTCYEVTTTDGRRLVADADHRWTVGDKHQKFSDSTGPIRKRTLKPNVVKTTAELHGSTMGYVSVGRTRGKEYQTRKYRFSLPRQYEIDLPERQLPIDPYLLGAWLGDGSSSASILTCAAMDLNHWQRAIGAAGYLAIAHKPAQRAWRISIGCEGNAGRSKRNFRGKLVELNVLNNKHIPDDYLTSSAQQRLALLQGLMDTDGTINQEGTAYFTSTKECLALGVLYLIRSLGWRSTINQGKAILNNVDHGPNWRVTFTPHLQDERIPFRLPRKACRIKDRKRINPGCSIKSIHEVASRPTRCIRVASEDGLFLAGRDLIPTHNTHDETFEAMQGFAQRRMIVPFIDFVHTGSGDEEIRFRNGSRILFGARERGFGRGIPGVDVLFSDEAQIMSERAMNAMLATLNTSWLGLHVYAGTPPATEEYDKAKAWMRKHDEAWVVEDPEVIVVETDDMVWIEFGATNGADLDDVHQWIKNPSVPHRTPFHSIQRLRRNLTDDGFRREGLGLYDESEGSVFDMAKWSALAVEDAKAPTRAALVVDVSPDRRWSAIGVCGEFDEDRTLLMVLSIQGTQGVAKKVAEMDAKQDLVDICITPGAARAIESDLTDEGVPYDVLSATEIGAGFGTLQEKIKVKPNDSGSIVHLGQSELTFAMVNTRSRYLNTGETESFDRRGYSVDISPAVAVAAALYRWGLCNKPLPFIG